MAATRILVWTLLLLCFILGSSAQTTNNTINLGSSITAGSNSSWRSTSGDFAFGFYLLPRGLFLVGIWFDKIPEKTLVWSANRDDPARNGSTIDLTDNGQLVLTHSNGTKFTIFNGTSTSSALMQDDGNFVLRESSSRVIWRSFDFPTDTILLGQNLVMGQKLYSNANGTVDYSTGRYMLEVQGLDGNVVLSAFKFADAGYWNTATNGRKNVSLTFNQSAALMSVVSDGSIIQPLSTTSQVPSPTREYYHRATINDLGNFNSWFTIKKMAPNGQWSGKLLQNLAQLLAFAGCLVFALYLIIELLAANACVVIYHGIRTIPPKDVILMSPWISVLQSLQLLISKLNR